MDGKEEESNSRTVDGNGREKKRKEKNRREKKRREEKRTRTIK